MREDSFRGILTLTLNPGPKAVLKTRALQTLSRLPKTFERREAFGVRSALAPLFRVRDLTDRFKESKRENTIYYWANSLLHRMGGERVVAAAARREMP